jgi:hypothetical protein
VGREENPKKTGGKRKVGDFLGENVQPEELMGGVSPYHVK